jgi:serine/threonine protein phosphatase PrpC
VSGVHLLIKSAGISDVGLKREGNEDYFSTGDASGLYIVADGMGGHLAGEVASRIVVEMINKSFRRWVEEKSHQEELFGRPDSSLTPWGNYILSSIRLANRVCYEMALGYEQYHGMGTTVAILLVTPSLVITANVGDSRIYRIRNGHIEMLSRDHTIVAEQVEMGILSEEEAKTSPMRHILTRNLGSAENVEVDVFEIQPTNNDRFILCSDGLTDLVADEEILQITQNEDDPKELGRKLVETVLKRGAHDNTTIVSVFLTEMKKAKEGPMRKIGLLLADILVGLQKIIRKFKP